VIGGNRNFRSPTKEKKMAKNNTAKGSRWRKKCQTFLEELRFHCTPRPWMEKGDDITASAHWVELSVEAKDHKRVRVWEFIDQAIGNATPLQVPVVMAKREGHTEPEDALVIMTGAGFATLLKSARDD